MTAELRRSLGLAGLGLVLGLGLVAGLFQGADSFKRTAPTPEAGHAPQAGQGPVGAVSPRGDAASSDPARQAALAPPASGPAGGAPAPDPAAEAAPAFDIVRVEANGEAVVAGRGAPNTVVEMLVDGRSVARALADANGQFALVPPPLPAGNSEIVLRATTPDGRETRSKESVAVVVAAKRDAKPLVALTSPDKPTRVLSQPEAPPAAKAVAEAGKVTADKGAAEKPGRRVPGKAASGARAPEKDAAVTIVSVDAQEGGRLYVTGQGTPGATVRLYLNDTLVAPARIGPDGKVTFTIGRGVKPGAYSVRVDQVDPASGKVRGRAEVPFAVPETPRVASLPAPAKPTARLAARDPAPPPAPQAAVEAKPPAPPLEAEAGPPGSAPTPRADAAVPAPAPPQAAPAKPPETLAATTPGAVFVAEISTAKIIRGDSLWQISRRTYGKGDRYTVIYDANQEQIRNPDLIYPGQIFVLPGEEGGGGKRG